MTIGLRLLFVVLLTATVAAEIPDVDFTKHISDVLTADLSDVECMALNIYHEARNETFLGMGMVAQVTMNRVASERYPSDVCSVVRDSKQFSWTHDGLSDHPYNTEAYAEAVVLAYLFVKHYARIDLLYSDTLLSYHADYVTPYWADSYTPVYQVGQHIFYSQERR